MIYFSSCSEKNRLDDIEIPVTLDLWYKLENFLANLDGDNLDQTVHLILSDIGIDNAIYIIDLFSRQLPKKNKIYAKLIDSLLQYDYEGDVVIFNSLNYLLLTHLVINNVVKHNQVFENEKYNFFYSAIIEKRIFKVIDELSPYFEREELEENDFLLVKEILGLGYPKNSLGYFIKHDDINGLKEYIRDTEDFDYNQKLYCLECFHYTKETSLSLLSICAFYGSIYCFNYLIANSTSTFYLEDIAKLSLVGGDFRILDPFRQKVDFGKYIFTALEQHRMDLIKYIIEIYDLKQYTLSKLASSFNIKGVMYLIRRNCILGEEFHDGSVPLSIMTKRWYKKLCSNIDIVAKKEKEPKVKIDLLSKLSSYSKCKADKSNAENCGDNDQSPLKTETNTSVLKSLLNRQKRW